MTFTMSGTTTALTVIVAEFSGVLTSGTIPDGTAVGKTGTGTALSTAAYSTSQSGDLVLVMSGQPSIAGLNGNPGGSWTSLTPATDNTDSVSGHYIASGTSGAQSATMTQAASIDWGTVLGALKADASIPRMLMMGVPDL